MRRTALHAVHAQLNAKFTPFAGWQMPLRYSSETAEHQAVRTHAGLFDLSHMGQLQVSGPEAARALDYALVGHLSALDVGGARYTMLCHENGGVLDDLVVYRTAEDRFLVVANACNTVVVLSALADHFDGYRARVQWTDDRALVAVQGPLAATLLRAFSDADPAYYAAAQTEVSGFPALVARTGYTGEDGFEIFCKARDAPAIWSVLHEAGARPAGLACRDTLRLEAGMALYGNELHVGVTPFEAGLGRAVAFAKPGTFVGRAALIQRQTEGPQATLTGLTTEGRRAARPGYPIVELGTGNKIGTVTSGAPSPTLGKPIALGYVQPAHRQLGARVGIDIRGTVEPFALTATRFYRRKDS